MTDLAAAAEAARDHVRAWPRHATVRIVAHQDPDGVAAAAVAAAWFGRAGRAFHLTTTWRRDEAFFESLDREPEDPLLVLDLGAADMAMLAQVAPAGLVVDHHPVPAGPGRTVLGRWRQLNPWLAGLDGGRDASAATTALALAMADAAENLDLAPVALVGALADGQDRDGLAGWNLQVSTEATDAGHLTNRSGLVLEELPLADQFRWPIGVLRDAFDPQDARARLADLALPPDATPSELAESDQQRLATALTLALLRRGADAARIQGLVRPLPVSPRHADRPLRRLVGLLEAATRLDEAGLGLAFLLGDAAAGAELEALEGRFHAEVRRHLEAVSLAGQERPGHRVARIEDVRLIGVVAGRALGRVVGDDRPLLVAATAGDDIVVSARAAVRLVTGGLDLGRALSEAARVVGGRGGGHAAAAGATLPSAQWDVFQAALDESLAATARRTAA